MQIWQLCIILRHPITISVTVLSNPTKLTNDLFIFPSENLTDLQLADDAIRQEIYSDLRGTSSEQNRLTSLNLSGTCWHKPGTRPPQLYITSQTDNITLSLSPSLTHSISRQDRHSQTLSKISETHILSSLQKLICLKRSNFRLIYLKQDRLLIIYI